MTATVQPAGDRLVGAEAIALLASAIHGLSRHDSPPPPHCSPCQTALGQLRHAVGLAPALNAQAELPAFYWTGDTDMACLRDALVQTLTHGYANHIQRLMVTGLFALMLGVDPKQVHAWYLAVYVDAVEWVELPNTLGMSQYADGGVMGSKPYIATGKYIQRMSPHCKGCRYDPAQRDGDTACPFTTLYWDFLMRHQAMLSGNPRMALQVKNLARLTEPQTQAIKGRAAAIRRGEVGASDA
jgi:deoxyribodipyrimidine photolyase-related protein